jgi:hypothetical protein
MPPSADIYAHQNKQKRPYRKGYKTYRLPFQINENAKNELMESVTRTFLLQILQQAMQEKTPHRPCHLVFRAFQAQPSEPTERAVSSNAL